MLELMKACYAVLNFDVVRCFDADNGIISRGGDHDERIKALEVKTDRTWVG